MVEDVERKERTISNETWWCFGVGISIPMLLLCSCLISLGEATAISLAIFYLTLLLAIILFPVSFFTGLPSLVSVIKNKSPDQNPIEILLVFIGATSPLAAVVLYAYYLLHQFAMHIPYG